ncbi:MAG: glycoside hydrolase family 9 protein [Flavisolibacter sp.]
MRLISIFLIPAFLIAGFSFSKKISQSAEHLNESDWIRINRLGYQPNGVKVAVWCSKEDIVLKTFMLIDSATDKVMFKGSAGKAFGAYGPFTQTYRLNFSSFKKPGTYYLQAGETVSPVFKIDAKVYDGTADFCLRYMRQQRSGFNPFLKDSCHTHDGYTLYGPMPDSTHVDVVGGWHDATDYLQYATTSANATYHLLMAYRDFPNVFTDQKMANGLDGKNRIADVLDEGKWGLDWLLKMHPRADWMFNQIADDRDHISMRMPTQDSQYKRGYERPVYFVNGEPQQRGKFMNRTDGTSSTAGKFASAFALGSDIFHRESEFPLSYSTQLSQKAQSAFLYGLKKPGVTQTVSVLSPYIYEEDNWMDDMELAAAKLSSMNERHADNIKPSWYLRYADSLAKKEPVTPWLGADTARHYQWYPFINIGHYELAKQLKGKQKATITAYYKTGIERVWNKAKQNAFYRGIPFIWCSNNLTTSFVIQCYWYKMLTADKQFEELEQANLDWLFGCNPWGTTMVYVLPGYADTPTDPHSSFTHLKNYPIDGGLVDGPVYGSIFNNLRGITLYSGDEYADFQSNLAVYHDDYGDYSTNEPTMDGTASLIYLLAAKESEANPKKGLVRKGNFTTNRGGIIRGDTSGNELAIVFTGDEFADGGQFICQALQKQKAKASFFFTGKFYDDNEEIVAKLAKSGHFLGNHSYAHKLCCDWTKRDSLLIDKQEFLSELLSLDEKMDHLGEEYGEGLTVAASKYFLPPYEWYNDSISAWAKEHGRQLINYTPGTLSHADYTIPADKNYRNSDEIYQSIINYEKKSSSGLNGFILLMHIGTDPKRTDKFYYKLPRLIEWLKGKGYRLVRVDELLD